MLGFFLRPSISVILYTPRQSGHLVWKNVPETLSPGQFEGRRRQNLANKNETIVRCQLTLRARSARSAPWRPRCRWWRRCRWTSGACPHGERSWENRKNHSKTSLFYWRYAKTRVHTMNSESCVNLGMPCCPSPLSTLQAIIALDGSLAACMGRRTGEASE